MIQSTETPSVDLNSSFFNKRLQKYSKNPTVITFNQFNAKQETLVTYKIRIQSANSSPYRNTKVTQKQSQNYNSGSTNKQHHELIRPRNSSCYGDRNSSSRFSKQRNFSGNQRIADSGTISDLKTCDSSNPSQELTNLLRLQTRNVYAKSALRHRAVKLQPQDINYQYLKDYKIAHSIVKPNKITDSKIKLTCLNTDATSEKASAKIGILGGHKISKQQRSKMVLWILEVLQCCKRSNIRTFFQAITILDRLFLKKQQQGIQLDINSLHLYGLVSIFMSSKVEDVYPISLKKIVTDIGFNKFSADQIKVAELEILQSLDYKVYGDLLIDEACEMLASQFYETRGLTEDQKKQLTDYLEFVCVSMKLELCFCHLNIRLQTQAAIDVALKLLIQDILKKANDAQEKISSDQETDPQSEYEQNKHLQALKTMYLNFKQRRQQTPAFEKILDKILKFVSNLRTSNPFQNSNNIQVGHVSNKF